MSGKKERRAITHNTRSNTNLCRPFHYRRSNAEYVIMNQYFIRFIELGRMIMICKGIQEKRQEEEEK